MTTLREPSGDPPPYSVDAVPRENVLTRIALRLTRWMEKWFPDSFVFVLLAVIVTACGALMIGVTPVRIVVSFGTSFWDLITFTMQAALVVIGGYVVASSPLAARSIRALAAIPSSGPGAVAFVATVSCLSSLVNWAFSLVFSALLVREVARRVPQLDYRAASAAAILGLGSVWALGLSSAPAQLQANAASLPPALLRITGVIPFSETIFQWQSIVMLLVLLTVSITVAYFSAPRGPRAVTAQALGIDLGIRETSDAPARRPGEWLECSRLLPAVIVCMAITYLAITIVESGLLQTISNLNTYNLMFLALGLLLHGTPRRFMRAVGAAVPAVGGVLIQFPFYAGVAGILTRAVNPRGLTLASGIAHMFTSFSGDHFAPAVGVYSALLGVLIPSGGGKWLVEAPYVMEAANRVHAHLGWVVQIYNAAEALPNLINPFWMIPVLGLVSLKARDIVGFSFLQFLINTPLVLAMAWFFAGTLVYHAPVMP